MLTKRPLVNIALGYTSKEDLITAINAKEDIVARDSKGYILEDSVNVLIGIMGYADYHSWTAVVTIKDGRITACV
jgi:hypothetical protein